jgi:hypothetical protein
MGNTSSVTRVSAPHLAAEKRVAERSFAGDVLPRIGKGLGISVSVEQAIVIIAILL